MSIKFFTIILEIKKYYKNLYLEIFKIIKEKRIGLSFIISFFVLIIANLTLDIYFQTYPMSIILVVLIFIISQYFDFEYRYFIVFASILLIACPFLLIFKFNLLAEHFANHVYIFLILGVICYFLDSLREKLKKKGYFRIYRVVFILILILLLISPLIIYREYISKLPKIIKHTNYYIKKENRKLNGSWEVEKIRINIENPMDGDEISGPIKIIGWAVEGNSQDNSGIDKIEIFIDGMPGVGEYLTNIDTVEEDSPAYEIVERIYYLCYDQKPENDIINYWRTKLESEEVTVDDIIKNFLSEEFRNRNFSDIEYINKLYRVLLDRKPDDKGLTIWLDRLSKDTNRDVVLYEFLMSIEYKGLTRIQHENISEYVEYITNVGTNLLREDIRNRYGEQFKMSGFIFNFDSTQIVNGKHTLYIYAYSNIFGWDYENLNIYINN